MSDRDDLIAILEHTELSPEQQADAIMAAGWMNVGALQDDLDELEATDPIVKRAAERYDEMVREVTRRDPRAQDGERDIPGPDGWWGGS